MHQEVADQASPSQREIERLKKFVSGDGETTAFPALAEAYRRAGQPAEAERVARDGLRRVPGMIAGRVALGLALLDQGQDEQAHFELGRVLAQVPDQVLAGKALAASEAADLDATHEELDEEDEWEVEEMAPESAAAEAEAPGEEAALDLLPELEADEVDAAFERAEPQEDEMLDADRVAHRAIDAVDEQVGKDDEAPLAEFESAVDEDPTVRENSPFTTSTMADLLERQGHEEEADAMRERIAERKRDGAAQQQTERRDKLENWLENLRNRGAR